MTDSISIMKINQSLTTAIITDEIVAMIEGRGIDLGFISTLRQSLKKLETEMPITLDTMAAEKLLEESKQIARDIEALRKEISGPLHTLFKRVNEIFKGLDLEENRKSLRGAYRAAVKTLQEKRNAEIRQREEEAERQRALLEQIAILESAEMIVDGDIEGANRKITYPMVPVAIPEEIIYDKTIAPKRTEVKVTDLLLLIKAIANGELPGLDPLELFTVSKSTLVRYMRNRENIIVPGVERV